MQGIPATEANKGAQITAHTGVSLLSATDVITQLHLYLTSLLMFKMSYMEPLKMVHSSDIFMFSC